MGGTCRVRRRAGRAWSEHAGFAAAPPGPGGLATPHACFFCATAAIAGGREPEEEIRGAAFRPPLVSYPGPRPPALRPTDPAAGDEKRY